MFLFHTDKTDDKSNKDIKQHGMFDSEPNKRVAKEEDGEGEITEGFMC